MTMIASLLLHHMERSNGIVMTHTQGVDVSGEGPDMYVVSFPIFLK